MVGAMGRMVMVVKRETERVEEDSEEGDGCSLGHCFDPKRETVD